MQEKLTDEQIRIIGVICRATGWEFVSYNAGDSVVASYYLFASHHDGDDLSFEKTVHGGRRCELSMKQAEHLANRLSYYLGAKTSGYAVMREAGNRYTLHDATDAYEREQQKTLEILDQNIDLELRVKALEEELAQLKRD